MDLEDKLQTFISQNRLHRFEGETGVRNFETIVKAIGYDSTWGDNLREFLADNPGCIEAMLEWIQGSRCKDWSDRLDERLEEDKEHDEA